VAKPTPQRVELGLLLRQYRERSALQQDDVERELGWHGGKMSRAEAGSRIVAKTEINALIGLFAVTADDAAMLHALGDQARKREPSSLLPDWAEKLVAMERTAIEIRRYDPELISGMFQTRDYAAAILSGSGRTDWESLVEARMQRRDVLTGARPPRVWTVLGEAALHRRIGGDQVLHDQLRHLLDVGQLPNVTVRLLPFDVGTHPALGVGFTHLRFSNPQAERVYLEGITNGVWMHEATDTAAYVTVFEQIHDLALDERRSATMLRARIKELT
jgi:hypothetical protein